MRAFRIGYVATLSFLLVLAVVTTTFGYFPPPKGPKAPEYPSSSLYSSSDYNNDTYRNNMKKYDDDRKAYESQQKNFIQDKIVPYAQGVFVSWVLTLLVFEIIGIVLVKYLSELAGAAFAFSGVWAVLLGPLGGLLWFLNSLVRGLGSRAEQQFSIDPIMQSVSVACFISIIALTALGILFYGLRRTPINPE